MNIDRLLEKPLYMQIVEEFELMIIERRLPEGDRLPTVRALAQELAINPNTIQKAFAELEARGAVKSVPRAGRYIASHARDMLVGCINGKLELLCERIRELAAIGIERAVFHEIVDNAFKESGND